MLMPLWSKSGKFASNLLDIGRKRRHAMVHAAYSRCGVFDHDPETRSGGIGGGFGGEAAVRGTTGPRRPVLGLGPRQPPAASAPARAGRRHRLTRAPRASRTSIHRANPGAGSCGHQARSLDFGGEIDTPDHGLEARNHRNRWCIGAQSDNIRTVIGKTSRLWQAPCQHSQRQAATWLTFRRIFH